MQRYTIVFITTNALYVSGSSSAHRQGLKTVYWVFVEVFVVLTAIVSKLELQQQFQLTHDSSKKQKNLEKITSTLYTDLSS